ncbi:MAG: redoxin domain-containing protein [Gemmataceae bacterium]|nr:redoxin domain-containing protein [Gemmataceae bacterium]
MRHSLLAVPAAVLLSQLALGQTPKVGDRHPDFTLPDVAGGKPKTLSDFRGKKVLLVQFASW